MARNQNRVVATLRSVINSESVESDGVGWKMVI